MLIYECLVGGAKPSLGVCLCRKFVLQNVGRSECVRSQKRLSALRRKDWHGLHEPSYCYLSVYVGTRNLNLGIAPVLVLLISAL